VRSGKVSYRDCGRTVLLQAGKFVAYDDENLFPQLERNFGDFTIRAHAGSRVGPRCRTRRADRPTIALETAGRLLSGRWVRHVADGGHVAAELRKGNLDAGWPVSSPPDPPGVDRPPEGCARQAFDRVGAFQEGYDNGPPRCADFEANPPELTDIAFTDQGDAARGGDLPYREVIPSAAADLDAYWSGLLSDYQSVEQHLRVRPEHDAARVRRAEGCRVRRPSTGSRTAGRPARSRTTADCCPTSTSGRATSGSRW